MPSSSTWVAALLDGGTVDELIVPGRIARMLLDTADEGGGAIRVLVSQNCRRLPYHTAFLPRTDWLALAYWLDDSKQPWHGPPMTMRTALQNLTPADWAVHHQELQRLQAHLFRDRTPQSLHIVGDPQPIAPTVLVSWYPEPPRRTLLKGGLQYRVHFPEADGLAHFSIEHWDGDRYFLHASYATHCGAIYTRFSLTRDFDKLADCFAECVKTMEREYALHASWRSLRR